MNIGILYTGGTIGCVPDTDNSDALTPLSFDNFSSAFKEYLTPVLESQYDDIAVTLIAFTNSKGDSTSLDSTNLQPTDWCTMAQIILSNYGTYDGFMVLHGTDTMAWTSSALSFLMTGLDSNGVPNAILDKPIIVTGAQLPLFDGSISGNDQTVTGLRFDTDAYQNVCGAVSSVYSAIPEVGLYFNRQLFRGNRAIKSNASEFPAFSSPNYPALAQTGIDFELNNEYVLPLPADSSLSLSNTSIQSTLQEQLTYITDHINDSVIMPFPSFPATYNDSSTPNTSVIADILNAIVNNVGIKGIILESYGEGNFPSGNPDNPEDGAIYQALSTAYSKGISIIDCTQVLAGTVNANAYAAGSWLSDVGAVDSFDMLSVASLCKLIYLTALSNYSTNNWDQTTIETLMQTNITGEIMNVDHLDAYQNDTLTAEQSISTLDSAVLLINDTNNGPTLETKEGTVLWSMLSNGLTGPGRLCLQQDNNLVFYDSSNTPIWASKTAAIGNKYRKLMLDTISSGETARLYLSDYTGNETYTIIEVDTTSESEEVDQQAEKAKPKRLKRQHLGKPSNRCIRRH